jgi:pyruvate dehydrogenase E2 component (dihydrolipoamide acetyltransferase)
MAFEVTVPRLGWSMEEGTFVGWLKADGEQVQVGELLFVLEGDKAQQEIEALDAGVLRLLPDGPRPGDVVTVGQVLAHVAAEGEPISGGTGASPPKAREGVPAPEAPARPPPSVGVRRRPAITPRARRAARELGIDWGGIVGTGKGGRIRERDIRSAPSRPPGMSPRRAALSPTRRAIADRLIRSQRQTAAVTLTTRADATNLVQLREQFKQAARGPHEIIPGFTDFLVKVAASALQEDPTLNARWEGEEILTFAEVHVGVAVDTDAGLVVPVIRDVPGKSLRQVAEESRALAARARDRKLSAAEMGGGTFTVSNLGEFGVDAFTPIINYPECAILGVGRVHSEPAVVDGEIRPRALVTLSLTFDHRCTDGAPAARFLAALRGRVETPAPWLIA